MEGVALNIEGGDSRGRGNDHSPRGGGHEMPDERGFTSACLTGEEHIGTGVQEVEGLNELVGQCDGHAKSLGQSIYFLYSLTAACG